MSRRARSHPARPSILALAGLAVLMLLSPPSARSASFVADLSDHLIAITTAFTGTEVLLFGAVEKPGSHVAVVVRGPAAEAMVRRKQRAGPIWVFTDQVTFAPVPSYYAVAASGPLAELAVPTELARHEIGVEHLRIVPTPDQESLDRAEQAAFRAAFVRGKQRSGLYPAEVGTISFLGDTLFRTRLAFPANVVPGTYLVQVYQFIDGRVANAQTNVLDISKIGLEAELYDFAMHQPVYYALSAILLAVGAGWSAAILFRRS
jgi:uncharacterized protein (TIGR02186 family)